MRYQFNEKLHLHLLDDKPLTGTSSVEDVLSKNLVWWAAELAAVECLESGEKIETIRQEYEEAAKSKDKKSAIDALQKKYPIFKTARYAHYQSKNKSAKKGVNLHEELEAFVKGEMGIIKKREYDPKIQPFIEWAKENVKRFLYSEAHCFDEELWVGGISDAGAELMDGKYAVIDFKSSKEVYTNQFIQTAGYATQIDKNGLWDKNGEVNKKLDKIEALIVVPFGAEIIKPDIRFNVDDYKQGFEWCVGLYRLLGLNKN